jgi:hypothetical protein
MAKDFYTDMQKIASGVLHQFDQSRDTGQENDGIWYIHITPGDGPKENPGVPQETPYKMDGAARQAETRYVDNSVILATDMQATVAIRPDVTPRMPGFVKVDGVRYSIKKATTIPPSGVPVATLLFYGK